MDIVTFYSRMLWIVFFSIVWITISTFIFFAGPSFVVVNVWVANFCGSSCTIYDFWMPVFWVIELLMLGGGILWSMEVFD